MKNMFYGSAPFFIVKDLSRSVNYYCDQLGFDRPHMWESQPPFAMPKRENIILMLEQATETPPQTNNGKWDAYFWVRDAQELYDEFLAKGADIHYEPELRPFYGNFEFAVKDPDGYILAFAQEITANAFFEHNPLDAKPHPKFLHINPVLASSDVSRDIKWYEEQLNFTCPYDSSAYQDGMIDYAVVGRQNLFLHLQFQYPKDMISSDIRFQVMNVESLIEEFLIKGLITEERVMRETAWNTTEVGIFDPNKNRLTFYEDL